MALENPGGDNINSDECPQRAFALPQVRSCPSYLPLLPPIYVLPLCAGCSGKCRHPFESHCGALSYTWAKLHLESRSRKNTQHERIESTHRI